MHILYPLSYKIQILMWMWIQGFSLDVNKVFLGLYIENHYYFNADFQKKAVVFG